MYRCDYCLSQRFLTKEKLFNHIKTCSVSHVAINEILPQKKKKTKGIVKTEEQKEEEEKGFDNILEFKNECNQFPHPFHVIADFESTLIPINDEEDGDTKKYQHHIPNSFGLKYNCIHNIYSKPVQIYNNADPEEVCKNFIENLEELAKYSYDLTQKNKNKINWKKDELNKHKNTMICNECKTHLSDKKTDNEGKINPLLKVAHHDHISGDFISTLCYECNLKFQYKTFLPVYIHNLKGYDAHLFINSLVKYGYKNYNSDHISCIPNNEERYISFSKKILLGTYINKKGQEKDLMYEIRFLDSFAFMASSIDKLAENLRNKSTDINILRKSFKYTSEYFTNDEQFLLMIHKGIYPYDYIDDFNRLYNPY